MIIQKKLNGSILEHSGILLLLGLGVFGGTLGASFFTKFKIPQVVGYIIIGLILGKNLLNLISANNIYRFDSINQFALGIVGFLVGGELNLSSFKKYGKQFILILLGEGLLSFLLVTISIFFALFYVSDSWRICLAGAVIFGAIASATDPASTINVLWENRSKGMLTTSLIAVVALDDALAMSLYGLAIGVSQVLVQNGESIFIEVFNVILHLGGAVCTGLLLALFLNFLIRKASHEKSLVLCTGSLLLLLGVCETFNLDSIFGAMVLGFVLTNKASERTKFIFDQFRVLSGPIYVIFFVLVGARMDFASMPKVMWVVIFVYVLFRSLGKVYGAMLGAKISNSAPKVQQYIGLSLFAQGGIAIGLSTTAGQGLNNIQISNGLGMGELLVSCITITTLFVQLLGPALVKLSIVKAGENDKDVTEQDVISDLNVGDVIQQIVPIKENQPISAVIQRFSKDNIMSLPVVDSDNRIVGSISIGDLKELISDQSSWKWVLTADVMQPLKESFYLETDLDQALNTMKKINVEQIPVLTSKEDDTLVGFLTLPYIKIQVGKEMLRRHNKLSTKKDEACI